VFFVRNDMRIDFGRGSHVRRFDSTPLGT